MGRIARSEIRPRLELVMDTVVRTHKGGKVFYVFWFSVNRYVRDEVAKIRKRTDGAASLGMPSGTNLIAIH